MTESAPDAALGRINRMNHSPQRRLITITALFCSLIGFGTAGYMLLEGWSFLDALYQTVTTLATVGFREVHELDRTGQIFTMVLIVSGVGGVFYTLTTGVTMAVEGELAGYFGRRRMDRRIDGLSGHSIICGFGRVGREIAAEFQQRRAPFVVVDHNPLVHPRLRELGYEFVDGNATEDAVLEQAGVQRARVLLAAADSDIDNTYIVLSARALNPKVYIIARAGHTSTAAKMRQAGADRIISPYTIAGMHMALAALQPAMFDFMSTTFRSRDHDLILAELTVTPESGMSGLTLERVFGSARDTTVLALRRGEGLLRAGPSSTEMLEPGDQLIVVGPAEELEMFHTRSGSVVPARAAPVD